MDRLKRSKGISIVSPVMAILQDHLLVPSRTICSACSRLSMCVSGSTENVVLKRRQFPRHRPSTTSRTPPPFVVIFAFGEESPLSVAVFSRHASRRLYVLRRPPKDTGSSRGAGDRPQSIQRHPVAAAFSSYS